MLETGEVAQLGGEGHGGHDPKALESHQAFDGGLAIPHIKPFGHVGLKTVDATMSSIESKEVFLKDEALVGREFQMAQVAQMSSGPVGLPRISMTVAQQEGSELFLDPAHIFNRIGAGVAQVTDHLVFTVGNMDPLEFAGPMKAGEFEGIAFISFDPFTGGIGNVGGSRNEGVHSEVEEAAGQHEAGGSGLVGDTQFVEGNAEALGQTPEGALDSLDGGRAGAVILPLSIRRGPSDGRGFGVQVDTDVISASAF